MWSPLEEKAQALLRGEEDRILCVDDPVATALPVEQDELDALSRADVALLVVVGVDRNRLRRLVDGAAVKKT
ncbi:hypothetical protein GGQ00_003115 [Salinibacter ruber]|jgi:hypothetical protein|uniref:Uncharacterized protein n=1 Tax=Salinibacter ruber TaxID=146919 RepID=A0AAW5PCB7_9BACT|nr:hypothetical protein [Salinibacter ruber]MCS4044655.1 hypothetical protein [Salinibacter ruber]MCS4159250.1 hypothetical protein [Salinibacter ruber]MCS4223768.1 hypothetical protein [Salinibacter ruber]